jgi:hypothetical protein
MTKKIELLKIFTKIFFAFIFVSSLIFIATPNYTSAASPSTLDPTERVASIANPNEVIYTKVVAGFVAGLADFIVEGSYQLAAYSAKLLSWIISDIVNKPKRDIIDNNPKNQCESYYKNNVKHIVKVTPKCELISAK